MPRNKSLASHQQSATILSTEKKDYPMTKTVKVTVHKWDNKVDGMDYDLSWLDKEYTFQLEEDTRGWTAYNAIEHVVKLAGGWNPTDCDVFIID